MSTDPWIDEWAARVAAADGPEVVVDLGERRRPPLRAIPDVPDEDSPSWTWNPQSLKGAALGHDLGDVPTLGSRSDGVQLIYPGRVHSIYAEPEHGKSWLALLVTAQLVANNLPVVYFDFEDHPASIASRLRALGVTDDQLVDLVLYAKPEIGFGDEAKQIIDEQLDIRPALFVIDAVGGAMDLAGLNPDSDPDYARWHRSLPAWLTRSSDRWSEFPPPAVLLVDHVVKRREERGRYASGSHRKLAAIDGAAYALELVEPFGRNREGTARIKVMKDRPGHVRQHAVDGVIGHLRITSRDENVVATIDPPAKDQAPSGQRPAWDGPTECMAAVLHLLEQTTGPLSQQAVLDELRARGVAFRERTVRQALIVLRNAGRIDENRGARNALLYSLATPTLLGDGPLS